MKLFLDVLKKHWRVFLALLLLWAGAAYLLSHPIRPDQFEVQEGYPLLYNIYSEIDFQALDYIKSERERWIAANSEPACFTLDKEKVEETCRRIDLFTESLKNTPENFGFSGEQNYLPILVKSGRLDELREAWKDVVKFGILSNKIEKLDPNTKLFVTFSDGSTRDILVDYTKYYSKSGMIQRMINDLYCERDPSISRRNQVLSNALEQVIDENLFPDETLTRQRRAEAMERANVYRKILKGQLLLAKTEKLTEEDVQLYQAYRNELQARDLHGEEDSAATFFRLGVILILLCFMGLYLHLQNPEIAAQPRAVWLWSGVILLCLLIFRVLISCFFRLADFGGIPQWTVFLVVPMALPSLLISVVYGYRPAIYVGIFVSGIVAGVLSNPFAVFLTGVLTSAIAAYMVRAVIHYKQFLVRAFLACSVSTLLCSMIFAGDYVFRSAPPETTVEEIPLTSFSSIEKEVVSQDSDNAFSITVQEEDNDDASPAFTHRLRTLFIGLILVPIISGLATILLAQLFLFLLESCCGVTSSMSYLTYTDRNHKLLKDLQLTAPGTYHHCERVALLAEAAADALGLDRVRVLACALFHDVGKLKYPNMFTENIAPGEENKHHHFTPIKSVDVIQEHVTYGLELGRTNNLPPLLLRAIQTHHGTDFISFFYSNALKDAEAKGQPPPDEKDFRYSGPLPMDKEVVLVMLADCCEAAVQSIPDLTAEKVQNMVNMLFEKKQKNGQLDASPLTIKELHNVQKAFVDSLLSMHNKRIAYPDQEDQNTKKQKGSENV